MPPQPSLTWPQLMPRSVHFFGVHGVGPHLPALQFGPALLPLHVPHEIDAPQPSATLPHSAPCALQSCGLHSHACVVWLHASDELAQPPQSIWVPQPSSTLPHCAPRSGHVFGTQAHLPELHTVPLLQVPHSIAFPQPSPWVPHSSVCAWHVTGLHDPVPPASTSEVGGGSPTQRTRNAAESITSSGSRRASFIGPTVTVLRRVRMPKARPMNVREPNAAVTGMT